MPPNFLPLLLLLFNPELRQNGESKNVKTDK